MSIKPDQLIFFHFIAPIDNQTKQREKKEILFIESYKKMEFHTIINAPILGITIRK